MYGSSDEALRLLEQAAFERSNAEKAWRSAINEALVQNMPVQCEALFVSDLQPSQDLQPQQVRAAILRTIRILGVRECVARVAQEFGDHPDTAVLRMRWAKELVSQVYAVGSRNWLPGTTMSATP
jgi:hypothetical protein